MKFNLFLIYYSRYGKEKNWMSDGLKLALSLCSGPPKAWASVPRWRGHPTLPALRSENP